MKTDRGHHFWRKARASIRDTWLLIRQFQWPLFIFIVAIFGGGILYQSLSTLANEPIDSLSAAAYHILTLVFLSSIGNYPNTWYLQIFYFLMPIIGIGILAQGVADFGVLFFNRRARGKEWEMAVASTFNHHVVLVGLGHLGFRVANHLHSMGQDVVVIDVDPKADLVQSVKDLGIPVIADDSTREAALRAAVVPEARAIILCTQKDGLNLQVAMKARTLNPNIQVVIRIFDDDFANALREQFGFVAFSTSATSSPIFAAAAAGVDMTRPITVEGQALCLASLQVTLQSKVNGLSVEDIERDFDVSVVLLRRKDEGPDFHPAPDRQIMVDDTLAVLGGAPEISAVAQQND
ncbi:MAG: NAD-binding protein [Anaerolineales bacterium]|nr:NAD-binding protein [Chloroflexota bacterium]MBL6979896.1 NAD-binding protein [Anaerolineales bacterium]